MSKNSEFCLIRKLQDNNYEIWQYEAKILLRSIDLWSIVENGKPDKKAAVYSS
ncbi:hypothetical protein TSAR_011641 [Trichomalopsis sarcophagae]|uniref:DUF4219 domain-containing protein n=1 Tax=Trichomalopsis sarcophagae TaxID=543379 RepID=A0A232EIF3_9HYME|nr:hypothetical protein TSAR_011641 [Trichomalopsis sarcophagae]